jgi:hypothetical protein
LPDLCRNDGRKPLVGGNANVSNVSGIVTDIGVLAMRFLEITPMPGGDLKLMYSGALL